MPKLKAGHISPTPEEDAAINRGIAADPDNPELTAADFKHMKRMGRPPIANPKVAINIRLSPDVLEKFRNTGAGWQTRVDTALRDWLEHHRLS
jgi:uncharacterized protein (DUF4415 family)